MIYSITHAFKVLKTLDIVLKDTPIIKRLELQPIFLVEPIDTTSEWPIDTISEQLVDDLAVSVKHVVLGD